MNGCIVRNGDATLQNLCLLLKSEQGEFRFDPFFGIRLKRYLFNQNDYILRDIIIDEIYTKIVTFIPQITVKREDIKLVSDRARLSVGIRCMNNADFTTNMYNIVLFDTEEEAQ